MKSCDTCGLYSKCQGPVPATGPTNSRLVIVGESPGKDEDIKGEPFVGDTGRLLNYMLQEANIKRYSCYITNAIKCFPNNTKLTVKHADYCKPILLKELLQLPNVECIIAFGNFATSSLIERTGITDLNGYWWEYNNIPVLSLVHPAHTLRNLAEVEIQIKHLSKVHKVLK